MKKILGFISIGLVLLASALPFMSGGAQTVTALDVKGFSLILIFTAVYIASFYAKAIWLRIVGIIGNIFSYALLYTTVFNVINKYQDISFTLNIGFYLLLSSAITSVLSLLIADKKVIDKEEEQLKENTKNKKYILPIYMYGVKNRPELGNNKSSITYNDDLQTLKVGIFNKEKIEEINIPFENITSISTRPSMTKATTTYSPKEDEMALVALGAFLFGPFGSMAGQIISDGSSTISTKYSTVFITEINYTKNNENEKIVIQTNYPPREFFEELKEKYNEQ